MRKVVRKFFSIAAFDKEEQWLHDMSAKGLALIAVHYGTYTFEQSLPGEYEVRLELLENLPNHPESEAYIQFVEETGAKYVGAIMRWVYFRKKRADGDFQLHSDYDSRISYLNRIIAFASVFSLFPLLAGGFNLALYIRMGASPLYVINLLSGLLCVGVGMFFVVNVCSILIKRRKLCKERQVFE